MNGVYSLTRDLEETFIIGLYGSLPGFAVRTLKLLEFLKGKFLKRIKPGSSPCDNGTYPTIVMFFF